MDPAAPTIIGRSSSHFTRVARLFAAELGVEHSFEVVPDLLASDPASYGGNPALRMPILRASREVWFGALNICRELSRRSRRNLRVVWPEELTRPLLANAQELAIQAMATEVSLILIAPSGGDGEAGAHAVYPAKLRKSLLGSMSWLDANLPEVLATLPPDRDLSYLEVTLFCLTAHLDFRDIVSTAPYARLTAFCRTFAERPSARVTAYRFDAPPNPPGSPHVG